MSFIIDSKKKINFLEPSGEVPTLEEFLLKLAEIGNNSVKVGTNTVYYNVLIPQLLETIRKAKEYEKLENIHL